MEGQRRKRGICQRTVELGNGGLDWKGRCNILELGGLMRRVTGLRSFGSRLIQREIFESAK